MNIKHLLRDLIIIFLTVSGAVLIYRATRRSKSPLVRIVVFHDVEDAEWFRKVIEMLVNNFNVITPQQFHDNEVIDDKINVLVTFDDGYQSWIENCLPVLDSYDVKGLFFVCSGLPEVAGDISESAEYMEKNLLVAPKQPLTWEGAKSLIENGHTVGGHTKNHPNVAELSERLATKEIVDDKHALESRLGVELVDFAYPFGGRGYFNRFIAKVVYERGYHYSYTALSGFVDTPAKDSFFIPRVCLEKRQSLLTIKLWIKGGYDLFSKMKF